MRRSILAAVLVAVLSLASMVGSYAALVANPTFSVAEGIEGPN